MNPRLRNLPCWCGSGRRLKHCHRTEKPRTTNVHFNFGTPVQPDGILFNRLTGKIEFYKNGEVLRPAQSRADTTYPRLKGPKVLSRTFFSGDSPVYATDAALRHFDQLYFVDTNSSETATGKISVGVVAQGEVRPIDPDRSFAFSVVNTAFEFRNARGNPERYSWRALIERVRNLPAFNYRSKVGIVVDSELNLLPSLNARMLPVCDDFYVPPGFEFLYASTDAGDSFLNKALATCDAMGTVILRELVSGRVPNDGLLEIQGLQFSHFRMWARTDDATGKEWQSVPLRRR